MATTCAVIVAGWTELEPEPTDFKVGCLAAPGVLPAQMPHLGARKAHIAQGFDRCSSHGSFHGRRPRGRQIVTERSQHCLLTFLHGLTRWCGGPAW